MKRLIASLALLAGCLVGFAGKELTIRLGVVEKADWQRILIYKQGHTLLAASYWNVYDVHGNMIAENQKREESMVFTNTPTDTDCRTFVDSILFAEGAGINKQREDYSGEKQVIVIPTNVVSTNVVIEKR